MSEAMEMPYRLLGNSGLKVSALGFGSMTFTSLDQSIELLSTARKAGINYFDNAEAYGMPLGSAETLFGKALKVLQSKDANLYRRSDLVITTKFCFGPTPDMQKWGENEFGLSRKHLMEGIDASLKRAQLDYFDVVYAHRFDPHTPMEEIVRGFTDMIRAGKAHYWGVSQWLPAHIVQAYYIAKMNNLIAPIVEQPNYNMHTRQYLEEMYLPVFKQPFNIGTTIWGSLDSGILTGKYNDYTIPKDSRFSKSDYLSAFYDDPLKRDKIEKTKQLCKIAEGLDISMMNMAIAWTLKNEHVTVVLLGAKRAEQLIGTCKCLKAVKKLTPKVMEEIELVLKNKPVMDSTVYPELMYGRNYSSKL